MREVGQRLQQARVAAGISLQGVADHLGLKSRAAVGHWETGRNPIDINKLHRLARFYQTTVIALLAERLTDDDIVSLTRRQLKEAAAASGDPERRQIMHGIGESTLQQSPHHREDETPMKKAKK